MKSQGLDKTPLTEMDKVLLRRYELLPLLKNRDFLQYIAGLIEIVQKRLGTGIPLATAVELISAAIKYEPEIMNLIIKEDRVDVRERVLYLFSVAIIQQLTKMGYLDSTEKAKLAKPSGENKAIFVIYGGDEKTIEEVKMILNEIGLQPILLHEQPSGSRTIVEKLDKYSNVGYAIVILTGDEAISQLGQVVSRARQNVLLEFGYFMGLLGRDRILVLVQEGVELPSDMHGIIYIPFKESVNEVRDKIVKELKAAGYEIKI